MQDQYKSSNDDFWHTSYRSDFATPASRPRHTGRSCPLAEASCYIQNPDAAQTGLAKPMRASASVNQLRSGMYTLEQARTTLPPPRAAPGAAATNEVLVREKAAQWACENSRSKERFYDTLSAPRSSAPALAPPAPAPAPAPARKIRSITLEGRAQGARGVWYDPNSLF